MIETVRLMNEAYNARHVSRLLPELRKATSKHAQAIWREAAQLGITDELYLAYRTGLNSKTDATTDD